MNLKYKRNEPMVAKDQSERYWVAQAREAFSRFLKIELIEIVRSGNKLDSEILKRGQKYTPNGVYVIIASTGGKWGKSRRNFGPINH